MDVIFEQRDIAPSVRATRDGSAITLSIEYQTNGWYDDYLGYFLFDYGFGSVTFGGQFSYASVGGDDDGWIYAAVTATLTPGLFSDAEVLFRLDAIDPFGTVFPIRLALLDAAGRLDGGDGIDALFGSEGDDTLWGGSGDDALEGAGGDDRLEGGAGSDNLLGGTGRDTYVIDSYGDRVVDLAEVSGGRDTVETQVTFQLAGPQVTGWVERLVLTGSADIDGFGNRRPNALFGNEGANHLEGRGGRDRLDGGAGADTLSGGEGADMFQFRDALGAENVDKILDFDTRDDQIQLDNAVMAALSPAGTMLSYVMFTANAEGVALDDNDRIIFETDTGLLSYDADGTGEGAAVVFARMTPGLALNWADFWVI